MAFTIEFFFKQHVLVAKIDCKQFFISSSHGIIPEFQENKNKIKNLISQVQFESFRLIYVVDVKAAMWHTK